MTEQLYASVTNSLRPLKLGFLIAHDDPEELSDAIEVSSSLWGGAGNVIISNNPDPRHWGVNGSDATETVLDEIARGYYENFGFDVLVSRDEPGESQFGWFPGQKTRLANVHAALGSRTSREFGVPLDFVLRSESRKRLQQSPISILGSPDRDCFHLTLLGGIPKDRLQQILPPDAAAFSYFQGTLQQLLEQEHAVALRRASMFGLEKSSRFKDEPIIFVMRRDSLTDVVDFWNMGASGRKTIPLCIDDANISPTIAFLTELISAGAFYNALSYGFGAKATMIKSRSVSEAEFHGIRSEFDLPEKANLRDNTIDLLPSCPKFWLRGHGKVLSARYSAREEHASYALRPRGVFEAPILHLGQLDGHKTNYKYVNEMSVEVPDSLGQYPSVYPTGITHSEFAFCFGAPEATSSFCSKIRVVVDGYGLPLSIHLPTSQKLVEVWLRRYGIVAKLSDKGQMAGHILRQIGGTHNINAFVSKPLVDWIFECSGKGTAIHAKQLDKQLRGLEQSRGLPWGFETTKKLLVGNGILRLGFNINCDNCGQSGWHAIENVGIEIPCAKCLGLFPFPAVNPERKASWAYKWAGMFSIKHCGHGSMTVLLTLRFFMLTLRFRISYAFSNDITINGLHREIDLILLAGSVWGEWEDHHGRLMFAECKTSGIVSDDEVERMLSLSEQVPGSIFVVATTHQGFFPEVIPRLVELRDTLQTHCLPNGASSNLMVLTGLELCSFSQIFTTWKDQPDARGAAVSDYEKLRDLDSICEITCSAHLGPALTS